MVKGDIIRINDMDMVVAVITAVTGENGETIENVTLTPIQLSE